MSAHTAKHAHSNGVRGIFDSAFTPSSTPATARASESRAGATSSRPSTAGGIRTFPEARATSVDNPFSQGLTRTSSQFSPEHRAAGKTRRVRRDESGSVSARLFGDDESQAKSTTLPLKYKKNHAMNSSQVFTAIAPDYEPRSETPASARLTIHLAKEADAENALLGVRDESAPPKTVESIAGARKRSKETAQKLYEAMVEPEFKPEGGIRPDKLGPGRGKKHVKGGRAIVGNSVEYNIIAPPPPAENATAEPKSGRKGTVQNISGVDSQLSQFVVPNTLEQQLKSKNVNCPGVTGAISVSNFAKLCMGADARDEDLPKSNSVERRPPGYRDVTQFASNYLAVETIDENAKTRALAKAAAQAAAAAEAAAEPTRTIKSAPFGNEFNDSVEVKPMRTIGPKDVRDPVTHALRPAVLSRLAESTAKAPVKPDDGVRAAGKPAVEVNTIWGFDETGNTVTPRAPAAPARPVPFATEDPKEIKAAESAPVTRPMTVRLGSKATPSEAGLAKTRPLSAKSTGENAFASAFAAAAAATSSSATTLRPLHQSVSDLVSDI